LGSAESLRQRIVSWIFQRRKFYVTGDSRDHCEPPEDEATPRRSPAPAQDTLNHQEVEVMKELLELLEENDRLTPAELGVMLGLDEAEVKAKIAALEAEKVILNYRAMVNWEKAGVEQVSAVIEVRVTPQRDVGFDEIAERIYRFPEVKSVFLMSGAYDLLVEIEGTTMKEVALFVAQKLATIENVLSTATHFVLKKYKLEGVILEDHEDVKRLVVSP
jgi:DNA-binding Lrp family transcriptional regulator